MKGSKGLPAAMFAAGAETDLDQIANFFKDTYPEYEKISSAADGAVFAFFNPCGVAEQDNQLMEALDGSRLFFDKVARDWFVTGKPAFNAFGAIQAGLLPDSLTQGVKYFTEQAAWFEEQELGAVVADFRGQAGLIMTDEFYALQSGLREHIEQEPLRAKLAAHVPQTIRCLSCGQTLLQTSIHFDTDEALTGRMLAPYGTALAENWSLPFGPTDTGENIGCLECGSRMTDPDGKLLEGCLSSVE